MLSKPILSITCTVVGVTNNFSCCFDSIGLSVGWGILAEFACEKIRFKINDQSVKLWSRIFFLELKYSITKILIRRLDNDTHDPMLGTLAGERNSIVKHLCNELTRR